MRSGTDPSQMETVDLYRLEVIPRGELRSFLVARGHPRLPIEGVALEAQFQCSLGYLVITSDGNPYEEMLHFYLINPDGGIMDDVSLGQIYHSGILHDLRWESDDRLAFSFYGTERWCLSILKKPRLRVPRIFSGVRYKHFGTHHLNLGKC